MLVLSVGSLDTYTLFDIARTRNTIDPSGAELTQSHRSGQLGAGDAHHRINHNRSLSAGAANQEQPRAKANGMGPPPSANREAPITREELDRINQRLDNLTNIMAKNIRHHQHAQLSEGVPYNSERRSDTSPPQRAPSKTNQLPRSREVPNRSQREGFVFASSMPFARRAEQGDLRQELNEIQN